MPKLKKEDYRHNAKITEVLCKNCGILFYAHNSLAQYCSALCKQHAYNDRKNITSEPVTEILHKKTKKMPQKERKMTEKENIYKNWSDDELLKVCRDYNDNNDNRKPTEKMLDEVCERGLYI